MKKTVAEVVIYTLPIGIGLIFAKVTKIAYVDICSWLGLEQSYLVSFVLTIIYIGFMGYAFSRVIDELKKPEQLEKIQKPFNLVIAILFSLFIFGVQAFVDMPEHPIQNSEKSQKKWVNFF